MLCAQVALLVAVESCCRRLVPDNGVTPFRSSGDPELAAELRPGFETLYRGQLVRINSDGYRGEEFPAPAPGRVRIALVGDSYAFGNGVALAGTFGEQLERALDDLGVACDVLNFGVPGYCARDVARTVEARALAHRPDLVLYLFFANDIEAPRRYDSIPPDAVIDKLDGFRLRSALVEWSISHLRRVLWRWGVHLGLGSVESVRRDLERGGAARLESALERMQAATAAAGVPFVLASFPYLAYEGMNVMRPIELAALGSAGARGVLAVDLVAAFEGEADLTRYWVDTFDTHPDADAYRRAAAFLARRLVELGVVR